MRFLWITKEDMENNKGTKNLHERIQTNRRDYRVTMCYTLQSYMGILKSRLLKESVTKTTSQSK